jgi:hypothetical protein
MEELCLAGKPKLLILSACSPLVNPSSTINVVIRLMINAFFD